jgi:hypothetical protein
VLVVLGSLAAVADGGIAVQDNLSILAAGHTCKNIDCLEPIM